MRLAEGGLVETLYEHNQKQISHSVEAPVGEKAENAVSGLTCFSRPQ